MKFVQTLSDALCERIRIPTVKTLWDTFGSLCSNWKVAEAANKLVSGIVEYFTATDMFWTSSCSMLKKSRNASARSGLSEDFCEKAFVSASEEVRETASTRDLKRTLSTVKTGENRSSGSTPQKSCWESIVMES